MRKYLSVLAALVLVAAAVFLPAQLSQWTDQQLMDEPHITQHEERDSFAESLQLTVGEKLLLLHSESLASMEAGWSTVWGLFTVPKSGETASIEHGRAEFQQEFAEVHASDIYLDDNGDMIAEEESQMLDELFEVSDQRLLSAWSELRALQSLGGLPLLWEPGSQVEYAYAGDILYVDSSTSVSFQAYTIHLACDPYTLNLTVDKQSGRILRFGLEWSAGTRLNWGLRGAGGFGPAWRDYWRMDSVNSSWYTPYVQEILESSEESLWKNGEYNANGQVVFSYDGQSLSVNLANLVTYKRGGFLFWNTGIA